MGFCTVWVHDIYIVGVLDAYTPATVILLIFCSSHTGNKPKLTFKGNFIKQIL
jgi:hypothetical protein